MFYICQEIDYGFDWPTYALTYNGWELTYVNWAEETQKPKDRIEFDTAQAAVDFYLKYRYMIKECPVNSYQSVLSQEVLVKNDSTGYKRLI